MEKCYKVSGYCPKLGKELTASVTYIFNTDCWEKGISEPPCANPCEGGCPILASAPAELDNLQAKLIPHSLQSLITSSFGICSEDINFPIGI